MLRRVDTDDVGGRVEIFHIFVSVTDAVVLGRGRILDVGDAPCRVSHELECRDTFTHLVALEIDEVLDKLNDDIETDIEGDLVILSAMSFCLQNKYKSKLGSFVFNATSLMSL